MLTPALAQEIATDTSALIGFNVLITDPDGIVIGSGDVDRVGGFHEASVEVVRTMRLAAHGVSEAQDLHGVRPGITLPLVVDGVAVGTVGITGAPREVKRFGLLVQRQTEMLLHTSAALLSGLLRERVLEDLVRDIASFDADVIDREFLIARAIELGYDLRLARIAIALEISASPDAVDAVPAPDTSVMGPDLLRTLRQVFSDPQDIVSSTGSGRAVILFRVSTTRGTAHAAAGCRRVVQMIKDRHAVSARAGLGGLAGSVGSLHGSCRDASEALRLGPMFDPVSAVHSIDRLRLHQLVAGAGHRPRTRVVTGALGGVRTRQDWPTMRDTIVAWCEHGFNLVAASTALNVHRNTLVYRLGKVLRLLGVDPRDHRGHLALYVACIADHIDEIASNSFTAPFVSAHHSPS